jgi:hypothetical protein
VEGAAAAAPHSSFSSFFRSLGESPASSSSEGLGPHLLACSEDAFIVDVVAMTIAEANPIIVMRVTVLTPFVRRAQPYE